MDARQTVHGLLFLLPVSVAMVLLPGGPLLAVLAGAGLVVNNLGRLVPLLLLPLVLALVFGPGMPG